MELSTMEDVFTQYTSAALQEQAVGEELVNQVAARGMFSDCEPLWRRAEARMASRQQCLYEVLEASANESLVIEQGEGYTLNRSDKGILLFMGRALQEKQLIEVHTSRSRWGRSVHVYEVRWTKPVQIESGETVYLVGGRRIFGPCDYLSF